MVKRRNGWMGVFAVLLGVLMVAPLPAAAGSKIKWRGSGGWGAGLPYGRLYDPASLQTLGGTVAEMEKLVPMVGMSDGVGFLLKRREETLAVHLGPLWYLERQDFSVPTGAAVEVVGSRGVFDGEPVLVAAEVRLGDRVLLLRDADGFPYWSGWRRYAPGE